MKITVNRKCSGHGRCVVKGPNVFVQDDEGFNRMGTFEVPAGMEEEARIGAESCPEGAIEIVEE